MLKADLHCHSCISDGSLTPEQLAERAARNGVQLWSLTDHDEVSGTTRARAAANQQCMAFLSGVEISVTWSGVTVHIVGLHIDENNQALIDGLLATRSGRENRAREIASQLADAGIAGAFEGALRHVRNPELISRTHFARYLIEIGVCKDVGDVFRRYLVEGKPGYVPHHWATLSNAIDWIKQAGGEAVVAHPGRYPFDSIKRAAFLDEFKDTGGLAIEVVTGSHTLDQYSEFATIARHYGFQASWGSDFHAPRESRMDLGKLPALPPDLVPVWQNWH